MAVNQRAVSVGGTGNNYNDDYTTTNMYVEHAFGFKPNMVTFVNDSEEDTIQISFDGATLHCEVKAAEYKDLPCGGRTSVYVKGTTGGGQVRINAT